MQKYIQGIIYKCENTINGKVYIGQTVRKLSERISHHKYCSKMKPNRKFYKEGLNIFCEKDFKWTVIDTCNIEDLNDKEIYYIKKYDSVENGYNKCSGGTSIDCSLPGEENGRYIKLDKEITDLIIELYVQEKWNTFAIQKETTVSRCIINRVLTENNIKLSYDDRKKFMRKQTGKCNTSYKKVNNKKIVEMYKSGKSVMTIGKTFKLSVLKIRNTLKECGIKYEKYDLSGTNNPRYYKLDDEIIIKIISMFKNGYSQNGISKTLNISRYKIKNVLLENNLI
jgi:DNA invertase Pin-like site-specific DNA recombinase